MRNPKTTVAQHCTSTTLWALNVVRFCDDNWAPSEFSERSGWSFGLGFAPRAQLKVSIALGCHETVVMTSATALFSWRGDCVDTVREGPRRRELACKRVTNPDWRQKPARGVISVKRRELDRALSHDSIERRTYQEMRGRRPEGHALAWVSNPGTGGHIRTQPCGVPSTKTRA